MLAIVSKSEIDEVMVIINDAKELLKKTSGQWQQGYPNRDTMNQDIINRNLYGIYDNNILIGIMALIKGIDENYQKIDSLFQKKLSKNDLVIHRLAIKKEYYHLGWGEKLINEAIIFAKNRKFSSIKIDTHPLNIPMKKLLVRCGFHYVGDVLLNNGEDNNKREVFERVA